MLLLRLQLKSLLEGEYKTLDCFRKENARRTAEAKEKEAKAKAAAASEKAQAPAAAVVASAEPVVASS